jgi:sugar phosphate isomerase/epimerase
MGDSYESFYTGGFSSFEPMYGSNFTGFKMNAATLSSNTNPTVANQVKEVVARLKEGVRNVEIGTIDPKMFESIPKQQFNEIKALLKLSGADVSLHAPINGMDPAGAADQGFNEERRATTERRLFEALQTAKTLSPNKGINVVVHSAVSGGEEGGYGAVYKPGDESKGEKRFAISQMGVVDKDTGKFLGQLKEEQEYKFSKPEDFGKSGTKSNPEEKLKELNKQQWKQSLFDIKQTRQQMDLEIYRNADGGVWSEVLELDEHGKLDMNNLDDRQKGALKHFQDSQILLDIARDKFDNAFAKAYEYGSEKQKEKLRDLANDFKKNMSKYDERKLSYRDHYKTELDDAVIELGKITEKEAPTLLISADEYAKEESSKTFGNLAWKSFNDLGKKDANKTPVLAIENLYMGNANATAEDLKDIIEKSRENFVKKAVEKGMEKDEAKRAAEKIIGATWDVGHLNMFKRAGFTDKDLVKQTEKIAKYVKHVHLTDNFGYADTHLAPGMGNVPFKEILKELEKTGKLSEMKKVIEAGGLLSNQLTNSQLKPTMEAFGVPLYSSGGGYWTQMMGLAAGGGYFGGQGEILPEKHFSIYGSGFSSLPTSMGGQIPGSVSRATGTPMA